MILSLNLFFTQDTKESKLALQSFLSAIFNEPVEDVQVGLNEIPIESEKDKQSIFDLTCTLKNKQQVINIEMQAQNCAGAFDNRSEYHVAHLLNHYVSKGTIWSLVPQAYMISVLNFKYDSESENAFSWFTMREDTGRELKSKRMNIIYLELPKLLEAKDTPPEQLTAIERWGKFFLYANITEKKDYILKLSREEEGIMNAQTVLNSISQSEEEWRRERGYIDEINNALSARWYAEQQGFASGHEKGLAQGLQQGLEKGRSEGAHENAINNARNLLKMNVLTTEQISQATGLTREEVLSLKEATSTN